MKGFRSMAHAGGPSPLEVEPRKHETAEHMIKRFTRRVREDGVLRELHSRRGYEKPSQRKKRKSLRARFNGWSL